MKSGQSLLVNTPVRSTTNKFGALSAEAFAFAVALK
jgi:hypothetical protein